MPLPMIAGMPFLAGILGSLTTGILSFLSRFMSRKLALSATFVVLLIGLFSALYLSVTGLLSLLVVSAPAHSSGIFLILPENFKTLLSTYFSIRVLFWAYDWNTRILQFKFDF